jgi:predicted Ser/Thr protein kinase
MLPLRLLNAWIDHHRLAERRREIEWQLGIIFKQPVTLRPTLAGGGFDRIYLAHGDDRHSKILASVRVNVPGRDRRVREPHLPRISLPGEQRIFRESRAYQRLAPIGIAPQLIARGENFLANHWLPWPRVSDVLRHNGHLLWDILPVVLDTVRQMHENGVVHADLNCGNLLIAPDFQSVAIIDFEYIPFRSMIRFDQQRFDYLRLAHSLLKRRRGREAAMLQPERFVDIFARFAPEAGFGIPDAMNASWFDRVVEHDVIREGFEQLFGILDRPEKAFV